MNKLGFYQGYMDKAAGRGRPHFMAMLESGDLPEDHNPHLGCPRVAQFESAMQKSWLRGVANWKERMSKSAQDKVDASKPIPKGTSNRQLLQQRRQMTGQVPYDFKGAKSVAEFQKLDPRAFKTMMKYPGEAIPRTIEGYKDWLGFRTRGRVGPGTWHSSQMLKKDWADYNKAGLKG